MPEELEPRLVNQNLEFTSDSEGVERLMGLLLNAQSLADKLNYTLISIHLNEAIEAVRFKIVDATRPPSA